MEPYNEDEHPLITGRAIHEVYSYKRYKFPDYCPIYMYDGYRHIIEYKMSEYQYYLDVIFNKSSLIPTSIVYFREEAYTYVYHIRLYKIYEICEEKKKIVYKTHLINIFQYKYKDNTFSKRIYNYDYSTYEFTYMKDINKRPRYVNVVYHISHFGKLRRLIALYNMQIMAIEAKRKRKQNKPALPNELLLYIHDNFI